MIIRAAILVVLMFAVTFPAAAMPAARPRPAQLRPDPAYGTRLAKFKKEQKRIVPDTMKRSTLHRINQLREDKKKRKHYKKDAKRALDERNAASDREVDPRFSRKGLSEEQIQNYMERYRERQRLRAKYDKMTEEK